MTAFKPCPFCGGSAGLRNHMQNVWPMVAVQCDNLDCLSLTTAYTVEAAIAAWNRRPPAATAQREEDAEECDFLAVFQELPGGLTGDDLSKAMKKAERYMALFRRLAAYARAPLSPPTEEEVEAAAGWIVTSLHDSLTDAQRRYIRFKDMTCNAAARAVLAAFIDKRNGG